MPADGEKRVDCFRILIKYIFHVMKRKSPPDLPNKSWKAKEKIYGERQKMFSSNSHYPRSRETSTRSTKTNEKYIFQNLMLLSLLSNILLIVEVILD